MPREASSGLVCAMEKILGKESGLCRELEAMTLRPLVWQRGREDAGSLRQQGQVNQTH